MSKIYYFKKRSNFYLVVLFVIHLGVQLELTRYTASIPHMMYSASTMEFCLQLIVYITINNVFHYAYKKMIPNTMMMMSPNCLPKALLFNLYYDLSPMNDLFG